MKPERWQQIDHLYHSALERAPAQRAAFLAEACAGDEALRREVEALIASHEHPGSFIEEPIFEVGAQVLAAEQAESPLEHRPRMPGLSPNTLLQNRYLIVRQVGQGGMGSVYLATDQRLHCTVALKQTFFSDERRRKAFENEAKLLANLRHPALPKVTDHFSGVEGQFLVMEYIPGDDLSERLLRKGKAFPPSEVLGWADQLLDALEYLHTHEPPILHRDIKPQNLKLTSRGQIILLDFGLAKGTAGEMTGVTAAGSIFGYTPHYAPLEQIQGAGTEARSDLYALGATLYRLLTGVTPPDALTRATAVLNGEADPLRPAHEVEPEISVGVGAVLMQAMALKREQRPATAGEMRRALQEAGRSAQGNWQETIVEPMPVESGVPIALRGEAAGARSGESARPGEIGAAHATGSLPATATARSPLSVQDLISRIKRHKRAAGLTLAALVMAAVAIFFSFSRAPALTEKDTVLLADFVNTTGDAVFDGTLKQALAVQLEQSPFLNIFPETRVQETLRYMGRSPDERVTGAIAREICQRQRIKALLAGSIASLGRNYVITLEAVNGQTGEALAREQVEAEGKEQVLRGLGAAASSLRGKLGESLSSVERFDAPIEQATTPSLEALKAFALGGEQGSRGKHLEAIPFYKRAVELDPNFALAYTRLAAVYYNTRQFELSAASAEKALELREQVSEREKLNISSNYYKYVTREIDKSIEVFEFWIRTYPRDRVPYGNLAVDYAVLGQFEKGIEASREAIRINPNNVTSHANLGLAFLRLNRFDEAREIFERALAQKLDSASFHSGLYTLAFIRGDRAAMQQQIDWATGKPNEYMALDWQADAAAFAGQARTAGEFSRRAIELAKGRDQKENAAEFASKVAVRQALFGNCRQVREGVAETLAITHSRLPLINVAIAAGLCGEAGQAHSLSDESTERFPKDTLLKTIWLPMIKAASEMQRGNPAELIKSLQPASRYEMGIEAFFWPAYIRGLAYLREGAGTEAAAEFQKILDRRGADGLSPVYPLAHLGLARAAALAGDTAKSRKAYQDFLSLWKDADPDIPVFREAKREYEKLK